MKKFYNCIHCGKLTSNIKGGVGRCNACRKLLSHKHLWMKYMLGSQVCKICGINRSETGYKY